MEHTPEYITILWERYLSGKASLEEVETLYQCVKDSSDDARHYAYAQAAEAKLQLQGTGSVEAPEWMLQEILRKGRGGASIPSDVRVSPGMRVFFLRRWGWAAAVIMLLGGAYWWMQARPTTQVATRSSTHPITIVPGSNSAILTLADGASIPLDSAGERFIQQGSTVVQQHGGRLQYDIQGTAEAVSYNTLATPRGGQFQLQLPDGTNVWLNASSTIRYPTAFSGQQRVVEVKGEAYFEVAQDSRQPFIVKVNNRLDIEVLGTRFNVSAYENETNLHTTLLDGKIKVNGILLKPGQQAQSGQETTILDHADTEKVMAWKNGYFNFDDVSLSDAMKQLERWYDIDVIYENEPPNIRFGGEMTRNIPLNDLLLILEKSKVHFRIEGRKLIVRNANK